ncbi:hypothetical protein ACWD4F_04525 [Streptomyces aureus]|uniref:hypothetical protein n=1 Tax=Streptomyces aureus TaxID=193461 RepID=UPI00056590AA|nr:hypothetical protein [Streptomyces aureus]
MTAPHQRSAHSGAGLRTLRAAVFAAVCVVLAAAGHGIASCTTVPLWTLGAGFLAVFAVAASLAGRERALPGIVVLLALGQTVLHTLFGLGLGTRTAATGSMGAMAPGTTMPDALLVERAARLVCGTAAAAISPAQAMKILTDARIDTSMAGMTGMTSSMRHGADALPTAGGSAMPVLPSVSMLLGHVLAAVAAGWVLRHGDLALLRLMRLSAQGVTEAALVRSLRAALTLVRALRTGLPGAPEIARTPRTALLAPLAPRTTALQHTVVRRGPPASTAFALVA